MYVLYKEIICVYASTTAATLRTFIAGGDGSESVINSSPDLIDPRKGASYCHAHPS